MQLAATIRGTRYRFASIKEVLAKANPPKSGDDLAGVYRDRFTGLRVETERRDGAPTLACPTLFGHFPIALLEREASR